MSVTIGVVVVCVVCFVARSLSHSLSLALTLALARSLNGTIQVYKGFNQSTGGFLAIKELRIDDLQVRENM